MDLVVAVAIGVLATIFLASLVALLVVCSNKYCRKKDLISQQTRDTRPDAVLVEHMDGQQEVPSNGVELNDVGLNNIEQILEDETWVNDATGLAPHCLEILKTCHTLTEKLVGMTMSNTDQLRTPETLTEIVAIAKRINPRVDDVVKALYPPLDPRLLEARCSALVLSVGHLVLVTKNGCRLGGVLDWIDQALADVEDHLRVLREASEIYEALCESETNVTNQRTPSPSSLMPGDDRTVTVQHAPQNNESSQV